MKRIVVWLASTVTVVVLLFGYHTSTNKTSGAAAPSSASSPSASTSPTASTPSSSPSAPSSASSSSTPKASSTSRGATKNTTYTGSVAQTRWGPVQVQIEVAGGRITKVVVLQQPNGNPRDVEINAQALPTLMTETTKSQSADIDMVSGATVTSAGYLQSLQAALDKAGI